MASKLGMNICFDSLKEKEIVEICSKTNPKSESTMMKWNGKCYVNWIEYLDNKRNRMNKCLDKMQSFMQYMDIELVKILNKYYVSNIFTHLDILIDFNSKAILGNQDFMHGLEKDFIAYYHLLRESEEYYNTEFYRYQLDNSSINKKAQNS